MIVVKKILNHNTWNDKINDVIILDHHDRRRRRIKLQSKKNISFLLNEKKTICLVDGALLILSNNNKIKVVAKQEEVLKIKAGQKLNLTVLAWHIGNRHIPAEVKENYILIKRDQVIEKMLRSLGANISKIKQVFSPVSGAYNEI